eukprot:1315363-Pyramimonas_sp.AAC.1
MKSSPYGYQVGVSGLAHFHLVWRVRVGGPHLSELAPGTGLDRQGWGSRTSSRSRCSGLYTTLVG